MSHSKNNIAELTPNPVWQYFYQLTQIPRPSFEEEAVQQFVLDEAERLGLWAQRDEVGNVLVHKPATKGMENAPGVILQNHLDMVSQKSNDSDHNFSTDPIEAYIDGDWVTANGTTLGADNGIGVACALAILASEDIPHGPLEALFTATEETGMVGALGLKGGWIQGSMLLNLDTEELGDICIGCAGGIDATFSLPIQWQTATKNTAYKLTIGGLKGGHSGVDIDNQRGNAALILARLLDNIRDDIEVIALQSGNLRNAIPRDAIGTFVSDADESTLKESIDKVTDIIRRGLPAEDRKMTVTLESVTLDKLSDEVASNKTASDKATSAKIVQSWTKDTQEKILTALRLCPNGVQRMSMDTAGVVETSTNLAKLDTLEDALEVDCLLRSLDDDARDDLANRMKRLFEAFGATVTLDNAYPGWKPEPGAAVTDVVIAEGEKALGSTPNVTVMHAGLECGILGKNYPNWQMVSFGPTIQMPHSPDERVHIESVDKFWQWLQNVLASLKTA